MEKKINCVEIDTDNFLDFKEKFKGELLNLTLSPKCVITKVNWGNGTPGYFSDFSTLSFYFECLKEILPNTKFILLESYSYERNDPTLIHYKPYAYRKRMSKLRKTEHDFLEKNNFFELFKKYNIEYINITEEFEAKNTVNKKIIKKNILEKFNTKVVHKELLKMIPSKLEPYFGCSLVSFTKIKGWLSQEKNFYSASMKNLFGLIPIVCRRKYHGKGNKGLPSAITDMNLIYRSLFTTCGIVEAIYNTKLFLEVKTIYLENLFCVAMSNDLTYLDSCIVKSLHGIPEKHHYLKRAQEIFGMNNLPIVFPRIEKKISSNIKNYFEE